ncbi:MAG: hypothetical protein ACREEP_13255 [Dongiaceae bacterium]
MQRLKELWLGELPLEVAFWRYAIFYGLALNVAATGAALILIVLDAPIAVAVVMHVLPIPYSVLSMCGVWRSADRYAGPQHVSKAAKASVVAWFCFWLAV